MSTRDWKLGEQLTGSLLGRQNVRGIDCFDPPPEGTPAPSPPAAMAAPTLADWAELELAKPYDWSKPPLVRKAKIIPLADDNRATRKAARPPSWWRLQMDAFRRDAAYWWDRLPWLTRTNRTPPLSRPRPQAAQAPSGVKIVPKMPT